MEEILLEIKHMNKKFGSIVALKNVDLIVRRGQIHGLIDCGRNAAGYIRGDFLQGETMEAGVYGRGSETWNFHDPSGSQYD